VAFAAQAAIDLRASTGRMTKKFNEFENNKIQGKQIDFPAKGRTKQLRKIVDRINWARNMADGRDRPMNLDESFRLERVAGELKQLAVEVSELKDAHDHAASARGLVSNGPLSLPREFLRSYCAGLFLTFSRGAPAIAAKGRCASDFRRADQSSYVQHAQCREQRGRSRSRLWRRSIV
jgi:hypothetical protein